MLEPWIRWLKPSVGDDEVFPEVQIEPLGADDTPLWRDWNLESRERGEMELADAGREPWLEIESTCEMNMGTNWVPDCRTVVWRQS